MFGVRIGPYRVLDEIGRGGAAKVYRAQDIYRKNEVAIKILETKWAKHPRVKNRFLREAEVLKKLEHPGIPKFYELRKHENTYALVEELCLGLTLEELLKSDDVIDGRRCVPWFIKTLDALNYAHQNGVIHRDMKPGNVLVSTSGTKILDFGLALLPDSPRLTAQGTTVGTIFYIPREQAKGQKLDGRADIYSLGVTLYQCVTGALPYESSTTQEVIRAVLLEPPIPPSDQWPILDAQLEAIILKAMAKDREQRYQNALEMKAALEAWLSTQTD